MEDGIVLLVDKPYGWTSFDVVKKIRNALKIKKVGHAGTLDPLATGLLIICAGKMTKQIDTFQQQEKEYTGTFVIGKTTESFDLEKEVVEVADISHILASDILSAVAQLTGNILQIPPMHSAIRKEGKRVYESARKGITLELEARPVIVHAFEITDVSLPEIHFRVVCSKGTYIRSLARDLGDLLGVGAYLSALTRTRIGNYRLEDAKSVPDLIEKIKGGLYENL
jgi:tRNA pseudouridine55 synthase